MLPHADMKLIRALGMILGGAMMTGCASSAPPANAPSGVFAVAQDELSRAIGTTTLTSAAVKPPSDPNPLYLTDEAPAAVRTWGAPSEQGSVEADLAANPYTQERDIYDPR